MPISIIITGAFVSIKIGKWSLPFVTVNHTSKNLYPKH